MMGLIGLMTASLAFGLTGGRRSKLMWLWCLAAVVAVVVSESRTALLALAIGGLLVAVRGVRDLRNSRLSGLALLLVLAVLVVLVVGPSILPGPLAAAFERIGGDEGGSTFNRREDLWAGALVAWRASPLLGYGYGQGNATLISFAEAGYFKIEAESVHQSYLQWLLEVGLIGVPGLVLLVGLAVVNGLRVPRTRLAAGLQWASLSGLIAMATESLIFGTGTPYPWLLWIAVGGAAVTHQTTGARQAPEKAS